MAIPFAPKSVGRVVLVAMASGTRHLGVVDHVGYDSITMTQSDGAQVTISTPRIEAYSILDGWPGETPAWFTEAQAHVAEDAAS